MPCVGSARHSDGCFGAAKKSGPMEEDQAAMLSDSVHPHIRYKVTVASGDRPGPRRRRRCMRRPRSCSAAAAWPRLRPMCTGALLDLMPPFQINQLPGGRETNKCAWSLAGQLVHKA